MLSQFHAPQARESHSHLTLKSMLLIGQYYSLSATLGIFKFVQEATPAFVF